MAINHRLLYRMQITTLAPQPFNRDQFLAVNSRQELNTGVDSLEFDTLAATIDLDDHNGAGTTVPFGTSFFRAFECQVFAQ